MATTLKALTTLALERGRAHAGDVFQLHNKTAAAELVAAGLAEEVTADGDTNALDATDTPAKSSVKVKTDKDAEKRETKPLRGKVKKKTESEESTDEDEAEADETDEETESEESTDETK